MIHAGHILGALPPQDNAVLVAPAHRNSKGREPPGELRERSMRFGPDVGKLLSEALGVLFL